MDDTFIWERRKDLSGIHFETAIESSPSFCNVFVHENGTLLGATGLYVDIFQIFKDVMNFTHDVTLPPDRAYGTLKNKEWNGKNKLHGFRMIIESALLITFCRSCQDVGGQGD